MKNKNSRLIITTVIGLVVSLFAVLIFSRLRGGDVLQRLASPDEKTVAEVREYDSFLLFATDAPQWAVELRKTSHWLRHPVFNILNYGSKITLEWTDPANLIVRCIGHFQVYRREEQWEDISIHYILE